MLYPMISGDYHFKVNGEFRGMIGGNATVSRGLKIALKGMVAGDLIVEQDAIVELTGMVGGKVINRGGQINQNPRPRAAF